jgi:DNA-nicking Smr family endonuclease
VGKRNPPSTPPLPPVVSDADEDRRMFERELAGVRRLPPGPERVVRTPPAQPPRSSPSDHQPRATPAMLVEQEGQHVRGAAFGVSRQTLRELARGDFVAEATCDLHGLRAEPARLRLGAFIAESRARRRRAVLVICGRGLHSGPDGPVLLHVARDVLTQPPTRAHVQAFASATPARGGEGALMVLLRR